MSPREIIAVLLQHNIPLTDIDGHGTALDAAPLSLIRRVLTALTEEGQDAGDCHV